MQRRNELTDAMELLQEMDSRFVKYNSSLEPKDKEVLSAGPFVEHEDSNGHLTYHLVK